MSKPWDEYSVAEDKMLYSKSFDLEEELASYELERVKAALLKTKEALETQMSLTADLRQKEKLMQEEIACLKEQVTNERKLREKAEDARGIDLVMYKLQLASKTAILTTDLQKQFEEKEKTMQNERLNKEVFTQTQSAPKQLQKLSRQIHELTEQLDKTKGELRKSEKEKASFKKECGDLKIQIIAKVTAIVELKDQERRSTATLKKALERLQEIEAENQTLSKKSAELQLPLDNETSKTITLTCDLQKGAEENAEMDQKMAQTKKHIQVVEMSAVQASRTWANEKDSLLKDFKGKLVASELEKQALMKKIEGLEHTAVLAKVSHDQMMTELQEEKAAMVKDAHQLKMEMRRKDEEAEMLQEMVKVLDQELEKKRRKWYRRLLCH